jgi:hypothetical protein
MIHELHCSWAATMAGQLLAGGTQMDEEATVARLGNRLQQAADILRSWVMEAGGHTIYDATMQGAFRVPSDRIHDLGRVIQQLRVYVETDYFFGIGVGIKESHEALRQAWRSQEPYAFYDEAAGAAQQDGDDPRALDRELNDKPLEKFENDGHDHWQTAEASANPEQSDGGAQNPSGVANPEQPETEQAEGSAQGGDIEVDDGKGDDKEDVKKMVAKALLDIKAQAAALHQLKAVKPEAFDAVKNIIQALVVMAHQLTADDDPEAVAKAESLWKRLRLPAPKLSPKKVNHKYPDAIASPASAGGTIKDGSIKVAPVDPKDGSAQGQGWNQARAGMVVSPKGSAVSSRNPNGE